MTDIRAQRLAMTKEQLVDLIEQIEEDMDDEHQGFMGFMDFLDKLTMDNNQGNFEAFMDWARSNSWDIPSALLSVCSHDIDETNGGDFFMHRSALWGDNDWTDIDRHFKEVHGLDLTSDRINWSFDT